MRLEQLPFLGGSLHDLPTQREDARQGIRDTSARYGLKVQQSGRLVDAESHFDAFVGRWDVHGRGSASIRLPGIMHSRFRIQGNGLESAAN